MHILVFFGALAHQQAFACKEQLVRALADHSERLLQVETSALRLSALVAIETDRVVGERDGYQRSGGGVESVRVQYFLIEALISGRFERLIGAAVLESDESVRVRDSAEHVASRAAQSGGRRPGVEALRVDSVELGRPRALPRFRILVVLVACVVPRETHEAEDRLVADEYADQSGHAYRFDGAQVLLVVRIEQQDAVHASVACAFVGVGESPSVRKQATNTRVRFIGAE